MSALRSKDFWLGVLAAALLALLLTPSRATADLSDVWQTRLVRAVEDVAQELREIRRECR